jgi:hypothetical protein
MDSCRHCAKLPGNRPRGLCWRCFESLPIRNRYPSESKYARRGIASDGGCGYVLPEPTATLPGTPERIAVLEERAKRGLRMHHPKDAERCVA